MCETVMMHLFNSYCTLILLYAVESVCLSRKNLSSLSYCWHANFWKLFGVNDVDCTRYFIKMDPFLFFYSLLKL